MNKAVGKPKSFLEIQQEQESDVHKHAVVSAMGASLSGKAPQKPKVCPLVQISSAVMFVHRAVDYTGHKGSDSCCRAHFWLL